MSDPPARRSGGGFVGDSPDPYDVDGIGHPVRCRVFDGSITVTEPDDTAYVAVVLRSGGGSGSVVPPTSTTTGWSERWGSRQRGWRLRRRVLVWVADAPRRSGRRRCPLPQGDRRHRPDQDGQAPP